MQSGGPPMKHRETVIVIGGGIAGIAVALRLAENGFPVTVIEKRDLLGGRASSFPLREADRSDTESSAEGDSPGAGDGAAAFVDNCQHVLMRCCVNLLDFYERIGAKDAVQFYDHFSFVDTQDRWSTLGASRWLPAPLHLLPSLFRFRSMTPLDKLSIAYGMARMVRLSAREQQDHQSTFGTWLRRNWQTPNAVECFWRPVIVSALNEEPDNTAAAYAFQLFRQAFLRSRHAYEMGLPKMGLAEIYSTTGIRALEEKGVRVEQGLRVGRIVIENGKAAGVCIGEEFHPAGVVVSAVPHHAVNNMLDDGARALAPFKDLSSIGTSPITGIHLWFDRPVTDLPHVALLGREMQWIFTKNEDFGTTSASSPPAGPGATGSYLGLVVSASRNLTGRSQAEIIAEALAAVHAVFPRSREAQLVRQVVIREKKATFSPGPGVERLRPAPRTPISGLYLAGDWIRTGWPATMEGAVRGGYLAAEAILHDHGMEADLLCPELPADLLPRLLGL
ncbi:MAG: hydroxysqualene dehydroxylase HpnE [Armatimonadota bacterium]|nr:hydroxysqualene dehydroxylase HpnE [Armatimonadota bacterium]